MKIYCKSCGSENNYIGVKPKTCGTCKESFGNQKIQIAHTNVRKVHVSTNETYGEERETKFDPHSFDLQGMVDGYLNSKEFQSIKKQNNQNKSVKLTFDNTGRIKEHDPEE